MGPTSMPSPGYVRAGALARFVTLSVTLMVTPLAVPAQVVTLDNPDATLSEPFSMIRGVRELSNGRIVVVDWIENRVVLADLTAVAVRPLLRDGPGPQEVRLPSGLVRLRGDTTLLYDDGNARSHILAPDGRSVRTIAADVPGRGGIRGVDATGAFLHGIPAWAEGPNALPDDSVRIVRWDPRANTAPRVIAVVQGTRYHKDRSPAMQPRLPMVGFASQDAWAVTPDGALAIVRATPYRVEFHVPGRVPVVGPAYPVEPRAGTQADRLRFVREFAAGSAVSGRGPNGGMGRGESIDATEVARLARTAEWSATHPPFDPSAVLVAADGRVWVGRTPRPDLAPRYDVFDAKGVLALQVDLPRGRRVLEVGRLGVYAVVEDGDGVQTIERYRLP